MDQEELTKKRETVVPTFFQNLNKLRKKTLNSSF